MGHLLETKDGIKNVDYLDSKLASQALTPEGWGRYIEGKVIRLQDFKVYFLEKLFKE